MQNIFGKYQGHSLLGGHMSRTSGLNPDKGVVTMIDPSEQPQPIKGGGGVGPGGAGGETVALSGGAGGGGGQALRIFGDLEFIFRGDSIKLTQIFVDESGFKTVDQDEAPDEFLEAASGERIIDVYLTDIRFLWQKQGFVSGRFNIIVDKDGIPLDGNLYDPKTLKNGVRLWRLGELIEIAARNLPHSPSIVRVPGSKSFLTNHPNNVDWGGSTLAVEAIRKLTDDFGVVPSFNLSNNLEFYDFGEKGVLEPESFEGTEAFVRKLPAATYSYKPLHVEVVGGRNIQEIVAPGCIPVTAWDRTDDDLCEGETVELFTAIARWGLDPTLVRQSAIHLSKRTQGAWQHVVDALGPDRGRKVAGILQSSGFKWYQVPEAFKAFLPFEDELPLDALARINKDHCVAKQAFPIRAIGVVYLPDSDNKFDGESGLWFSEFSTDLTPYLESVDQEEGIIKLNRPIGFVTPSEFGDDPNGVKDALARDSWEEAVNDYTSQVSRAAGDPGNDNPDAIQKLRDDALVKRLVAIAQIDSRLRGVAAGALRFVRSSPGQINLEEMILSVGPVSIRFAYKMVTNQLNDDGQSSDFYRFRKTIAKDDQTDGVFPLPDEKMIVYRTIDGGTNKPALDRQAEQMIDRLYTGPGGVRRQDNFVDFNWVFKGAQTIATSGRSFQVAWDFELGGPDMTTRVMTRDLYRGIAGRPGYTTRALKRHASEIHIGQ